MQGHSTFRLVTYMLYHTIIILVWWSPLESRNTVHNLFHFVIQLHIISVIISCTFIALRCFSFCKPYQFVYLDIDSGRCPNWLKSLAMNIQFINWCWVLLAIYSRRQRNSKDNFCEWRVSRRRIRISVPLHGYFLWQAIFIYCWYRFV